MEERDETSTGRRPRLGEATVLSVEGLAALLTALADMGYEVKGPTVRDGAVVVGALADVSDLPMGWRDEQSPGHYRLEKGEGEEFFAWAVGPGSWKAEFFPASQEVWRAHPSGDAVSISSPPGPEHPLAILGARPCDAAALRVLDRVLRDGSHRDDRYGDRRDGAFLVVAECGHPATTCFCTSMGSGPGVDEGFDLALCEVDDARGHRFVVRAGTERGAEVLERVPRSPASEDDVEARSRVLADAVSRISRRLEADGVADLLARNLHHPRWDGLAKRCLTCGNCTLVCPTCFCSDVHDTTDISGTIVRTRSWSSCFDLEHSYIHGGAVRASTTSRYRQWMTHKLSTWWDQFDSSGCVGCGRCVTWCPVGIDITEEAAAIRATDGATGVELRNEVRS